MNYFVRQTIFAFVLGATISFACSAELDGTDLDLPNKRPNIVFIVVDDMRTDEYGAGGHPYLKTPNIDRLAAEGATFTRAYHATPLCSPNRASLLTGQYASRHGILDNTSRSYASHRLNLFPKELQKAGYRTAHIGKWHMGNDPTPRPGYDYWISFRGQGRSKDPILYEDGKLQEVKGYITDIFTDRTVDFINRESGKPFFVYIGHKAVHPDMRQLDDGSIDIEYGSRFIPAERHEGTYDGQFVERKPSHGFSEKQSQSKPVLKEALDIKNSADLKRKFGSLITTDVSEETIRRRAEMMRSVEEGVGRIIAVLEENNILNSTLIILTTDNGYFYGEHGLTVERRLPYEEAIRSPLMIRYPRLVAPGTVIDSFSSSVDLAPTILDLVGIEIPKHIQGVSLLPLFKDHEKPPRDSVFVEYYSHENPMPWTANLDYRAILKGDYKYIKWIRYENKVELYDLAKDPYEQNNLAGLPAFASVLAQLKMEMNEQVLHSLGLK
jgi:N-acetylglucosamine-6-sulfatase